MPDILNKILKIGHHDLYKLSEPVEKEEISGFEDEIRLMGDCILATMRAIDNKSFRWREAIPLR